MAETENEAAELDLAELKRIAEAAIGAEWQVCQAITGPVSVVAGPNYQRICSIAIDSMEQERAAHIVAFQPRQALALLSSLAEARAEREGWRSLAQATKERCDHAEALWKAARENHEAAESRASALQAEVEGLKATNANLLAHVEAWAKMALDLNTFADHDSECPANWGKLCECGLSDLSSKTIMRAEDLAAGIIAKLPPRALCNPQASPDGRGLEGSNNE